MQDKHDLPGLKGLEIIACLPDFVCKRTETLS